jgi:hypothetical protein
MNNWKHKRQWSVKDKFIFKRSKSHLSVSSTETVKMVFFLSEVEVLQVLGVEVSGGGSNESNVRSFEAFVTIYLSITRNI